jgi:gamma-glutamyltranspeptidase/glutathione hydrolase
LNIDLDGFTYQHSGIGGGGFMLVRSSDGKFEDIDFREMAPAAAFQDMYKQNVVMYFPA